MYKKITQGGRRKMHKKDNSEKDIENKSTRRKNKNLLKTKRTSRKNINLQKTKGRVERINNLQKAYLCCKKTYTKIKACRKPQNELEAV